MFTTMVLGVDGSAESARAVEVTGALAKALHARVVVVHVLPDPALALPVVPAVEAVAPPVIPSETLAELQRAGQAILAQAAAVLQRHGTRHETRLAQGAPGDELVRVARETQADLLVVGSRGHGRLEEVLLGSVSDAVSRTAPCSVLIVR